MKKLTMKLGIVLALLTFGATIGGIAYASGVSVESGGYWFVPKLKVTNSTDNTVSLGIKTRTRFSFDMDGPGESTAYFAYNNSTGQFTYAVPGGSWHDFGDRRIRNQQPSGANAIEFSTDGARLDLGPGANDYLYAGSNNIYIGASTTQNIHAAGIALYNYSVGTSLNGTTLSLRPWTGTGASSVGVKITPINALTLSTQKILSIYSDDGTTERAYVRATDGAYCDASGNCLPFTGYRYVGAYAPIDVENQSFHTFKTLHAGTTRQLNFTATQAGAGAGNAVLGIYNTTQSTSCTLTFVCTSGVGVSQEGTCAITFNSGDSLTLKWDTTSNCTSMPFGNVQYSLTQTN